MPYQLQPFAELGLDGDLLRVLIEEHESVALPAFERFWSYYRNEEQPGDPLSGRRPRSAQHAGLPARLTRIADGIPPKEIVIENDIGWRIHSLIDYVAGREVTFQSRAADERRRSEIGALVRAIFDGSGGLGMLQDAVLLGSVYGHVDILVRFGALFDSSGSGGGSPVERAPSEPSPFERAVRLARRVRLETVEAPRAIPLLDPRDYTRLDALILHYQRWLNEVDDGGFLSRLSTWLGGSSSGRRATATVTEIISATHRQVYEDESLILSEPNRLGRVPLAHVQHQRRPFAWGSPGEVEPLIPLQDELNTRLSDRANRVTLQCFKMYLGRRIEGFGERPVGPGQMWIADDPEARIESFGGDAESPSEESHIREVREALDKISAVTPLAAGMIRAKVGTLSSENACAFRCWGFSARRSACAGSTGADSPSPSRSR